MSLKKKLVLAIMGSILLASSSISIIVYVYMKKTVTDTVNSELDAKVEQYRSTTLAYYKSNYNSLGSSIRVASDQINSTTTGVDDTQKINMKIIHQTSNEQTDVTIGAMKIDGKTVYQNDELIDHIAHLTGGAVTLFQTVEEGLVRISTNIKKDDGQRATRTYIPKDNPIYEKIMSGEDYYGRAFVINEWYLSIYRPIKVDGKIIGAIFVGKAESNLNELKDEIRKQKFGETGYAYIVDYDGKLIVHNSIEGKSLYDLPDADGKMFFQEMHTMKNGIHTYNWKHPTTNSISKKTVAFKSIDEMRWMIVAGMDHSEMYEPINRLEVFIVLVTVGILIIGFFLSLYLQKTISGPLISATESLTKTSSKVDNSIEIIFKQSNVLKDGTTNQASSLTETSHSIDFIKNSIEDNNRAIEKSVESVRKGIGATVSGKEAVDQMIAAIQEIEVSNHDVVAQIQSSTEKMNAITQIITEIAEKANVINDIVFQTKLLSFNASVEAARAGVHGKGFSIVAEEVGNLANMSGQSASEIQALLNDGIAKVEELAMANKVEMERIIKQSSEKINRGILVARSCQDELNGIATTIGESGEISKNVMEASHGQFQSISEINEAVFRLNEITNKNLEVSDETSMSATGLKNESQSLKGAINEVVTAIFG
ncbi:methyl-accepting chemotaxis protein signaling domain protein [Bacteriovorax sp. BSW11_IV]|uniref:methyl-accepting chemotaxis protein n=1 Tax=Bacteriovorax sp. BSW11_IV TaxID=1353529 RepID=UPI00038A1457|nr:Cache 3/Cache 2 fusion domain-containing protein [Bacteriovorax sp. BSW11_IV]EQC48639.1 methyl-accepting chemotaxis protein signaling domain protein [Bacteriovorax sp. BSW11_IV]